ncbi:MAG: carboxypeptidase regulatory-like domain-containing protein, partial [Deltaproteobacteria bacterium]|nr:carboxypeptidase regulatory-like domain-containing protein [Deltaproteobacteria bacterium]
MLFNMVNANLDAGYPVLLGIKRSSGYHSIVGDGYGNQWGAWYHHLNMGWGGSQNLWYNLPNIDAANPPYNTVCDTVYNIYTSGAGEIISGRVTNSCGSPVGGATVTASGPGSPPAVTTSASGIFAFPKVAANASYTIHVNGTGYTDQVVTTGESLDGTLDTGNRWGVNFVANRAPVAPEYVLYSLGGLDLKASNAYAINNNGSIVGGMKVNNSYLNNNPCIWREGEKGQFGFYRVGSDVVDYGELLGINDNGDLAVGYAYKSTWPSGTQELPIYLDWFMNFGYLQVPSTPSPYGRAYGVNNSDQIVGNTSMESNDISACLWPNRTTMAQRIDNLGGTAGTTQTLANRINNAGKIVGKYYGGISIRAFFWDGANVNWLGPASGNSEACSLNNLNSPTVVGLTGTRGYVGTRAVIFNGAAIQELSNTDSTALGVNGQGQIVGSSKFGSRSHAFIYDSQAGLRDLNALLNEPDWELVTANDINDNGEIVGSGWYKCIIQFAYMLRPLYTITATAGAGGTIAPSGAVKVIRGEDITFKILPNASYRIVDVLVDGVSQGPIGIYTFTNVTANHTIAATFTGGTTYTITANAGNGGSITPSGSVAVNGGGSQNFKITASPGYRIADVKVDNVSQGAISSYTFSNVTANHTIAASFTPGATTYNIVASAGSGGSISPSGTVTLNAGDSQTFTITANS